MTYLVVEDGTGVDGANGYVTLDECSDYALEHGLTFATSPSTTGEQAIIRATASLDAMFRTRYPGYKTNGRSQPLEWPRTDAYDREDNAIAGGEIPQEVKDATCELAVRELDEAGSTMPDLERGGQIRRMKAGSVEIEYGANASAVTVFGVVDGIMASLLGPVTSPYVGRAVRA